MKELKPRLEAEYIIRQYYKVTPDESPIDEYWDSMWTEDENGNHRRVNQSDTWAQEERARFHRLFKAIIASKEALQAVYEYIVLLEHFLASQEEFDFFEAHYGKGQDDVSFLSVLRSISTVFTPEDQRWLLETEDDMGESLEKCFKIEAVGWNMGEHVH